VSVESIGGYRQLSGLVNASAAERLASTHPEAALSALEDPATRGIVENSGLLGKLVSAAVQASPQRAERVATLRNAIAQGTYKVPIATLAEKLLGHGE